MEKISNLVSVSDHVLEGRDTWTSRMSKAQWGDRIPHVERDGDGIDHWVIDGRRFPLAGSGSLGAGSGVGRIERWEDIPAAAYDPVERLKAMDQDDIAVSVLYPMVAGIAGETFAMFDDDDFTLACAQAYNDFLIEDWVGTSDRFIAQCIVPISTGDAMAAEVRRSVAKGHRGVVLPAAPSLLREDAPMLNDPCFDPLWAVCEELGVPVVFHAGASEKLRMPTYKGYSPELAAAYRAMTMPQSGMSYLPNFLMSGILDRHRGLRAIFTGASAGLINFVLDTTEYLFDSSKNSDLGYSRTPNEMFRDQCYAVAIYDERETLTHASEALGASRIMWGTEYPFGVSTWPDTSARLGDALSDLSVDDRQAILTGNAACLYTIATLDRAPIVAAD